MTTKQRQLKYLPLPIDTEHKLNKTSLCVWVNPPANTARHLREMSATLAVANALLVNEYRKPGIGQLLTAIEPYQKTFLESLSQVLNKGPEATHFTDYELAHLANAIGEEAAEQLISDVLAALPLEPAPKATGAGKPTPALHAAPAYLKSKPANGHVQMIRQGLAPKDQAQTIRGFAQDLFTDLQTSNLSPHQLYRKILDRILLDL